MQEVETMEKLSSTIYPDYKKSITKTDGEVMDFFLPADYFSASDMSFIETDFSELQFEVPLDFVISNNSVYKPKRDTNGKLILKYWNKETVKSWRENDWTFEEAEDISYRAVVDRKLVSFNFMK